ncbi:MAG: zf-HC2 domain-containing protein [Thermodesulforhabdaceae bacterium]
MKLKSCIYTPDKRDELITLALMGELSPESESFFRNHITSCEVCMERVTKLSEFYRKLKTFSEPEPLNIWEIARLTRAIRKPKHKSVFTSLLKPVAVGLCVMIITVGGWWKLRDHSLSFLTTANIQQEENISPEDLNVIAHIDMLEELDSIEKLTKVLDEGWENQS